MRSPSLPPFALFLLLAVAAPPLAADDKVDFAKEIEPIFRSRCVQCHGPKKQKAKLRFDRRATILERKADEAVIVPGKSGESTLFDLITRPDDDTDRMPNEGDPLTKDQIEKIRLWIDQGANWPDAAAAPADEKEAEKSGPPPVESFALKPLGADEAAAQRKVIDSLVSRGILAQPVAQNLEAVDVNFSLKGASVSDADLERLDGLEATLVWLNLARTGVGDAGVARLARFRELRKLNLSGTKVTDAGLASLAGLGKLTYLNLYGTGVTDTGLESLKGLPHLRNLYLWQTKATDEGVAKLVAALPGLVVDQGKFVEPPKPEPAINANCPMTGKPVDPAFSTVYQGKRIGFCCGNCLAAFLKAPEETIGKVKEFTKE